MNLKKVVVTGIGALTPIGKNVGEFWQGLSNGVSGAADITRFDTTHFRTKFACEVKDYDPNDYFDRKEGRKMDFFTQYALIAASEAMENSGLNTSSINLDRAGIIWAAGIGGLQTISDEIMSYADNGRVPRFSPFLIPKLIPDISAGHLSIIHGFRGPNYATVSACASATNALIDAYHLIKLGKSDVIISGGSEAAITEVGVGGFSSMKALSERNDSPETASRPFDKDRDGFVMGEGAGALILEEYEHAKARGARIYCEIIGAGLSADAHHITAPHPDGLGARLVMKNALDDAEITPEEMDYVNVHGTSTPLGDISEVLAIKEVFGEHAYNLNIGATKSMTGHLLGAAGGVEAIACILAMQNNLVPPTINHFTDDDNLDNNLNFTFNKAQAKEINTALSNTFGFGGHNTSVIFRKIV